MISVSPFHLLDPVSSPHFVLRHLDLLAPQFFRGKLSGPKRRHECRVSCEAVILDCRACRAPNRLLSRWIISNKAISLGHVFQPRWRDERRWRELRRCGDRDGRQSRQSLNCFQKVYGKSTAIQHTIDRIDTVQGVLAVSVNEFHFGMIL